MLTFEELQVTADKRNYTVCEKEKEKVGYPDGKGETEVLLYKRKTLQY